MALLAAASIYALARLRLGLSDEWLPILVNIAWVIYEPAVLGVVITAITYRPPTTSPSAPRCRLPPAPDASPSAT